MIKVLHLTLILTVATLFNHSFGQNLVPNPSFEDYSTCPVSSFEIGVVDEWTNAGGTPDYFNACSSSGGASVPLNFSGYEYAAKGLGYVGIYLYNDGVNWPDNREFIFVDLIQPLEIGTKYYVSFDLSFTLDGLEIGYACNGLGLLFTENVDYNISNPPETNNQATVFVDTIISDTLGWYHYESSFISDSSYSRIYLGNFFDDINTDTVSINNSLYTAYYFIDNICVSSDSLDCVEHAGLFDYSEETISVFPNPLAGNVLEINLPEELLDFEIFLTDAAGRQVQFEYEKNQNKCLLRFTDLDAGYYQLVILNQQYFYSSKFLKL